jgi:hypothetical protein
MQSKITPLPYQVENNEDNYLTSETKQWAKNKDYLMHKKMSSHQYDSLYSQNNNFNIISGHFSHSPNHRNLQRRQSSFADSRIEKYIIVCFSNGKIHIFDEKTMSLSSNPIIDVNYEILNIFSTHNHLILHLTNGIYSFYEKSNLSFYKQFHTHTSSIITSYRIFKISQFANKFKDKNNYSVGNDACFLRKKISDKILTDKNIQTFSINHQFENFNNKSTGAKYSDSLDHYAINSQQIENTKQKLLKKKFMFMNYLNPKTLNKDQDILVTLDSKGKILFWQFHLKQSEYGTTEEFVNVGHFKMNLQDRRGIVTAVGFQNILIVGFKTRHVAIYYLGVDAPTFEFIATDAPIKEIQIKEVRFFFC